jgi:hypothetical protein
MPFLFVNAGMNLRFHFTVRVTIGWLCNNLHARWLVVSFLVAAVGLSSYVVVVVTKWSSVWVDWNADVLVERFVLLLWWVSFL